MSFLKLEHITKTYLQKKALDDITFTIDQNAFVVLAGPSGCGKSTLLNIIAGLEKSNSGMIYLNDKEIQNALPKDRNMAMVFQEAALFDHLTAYENIAFGLLDEIEKVAEHHYIMECAALLKIERLLNHKAKTLSGGERQRVSIARALVRKPKLFLMDEPLSSLDARLKNELRIELAALYHKNDTAFLYVTHDQMEAMTLADILILMKDGKIQQVGPPKQIYRQPINLFTASFLGKYDINVFRGKIYNQTLYWEEKAWPIQNAVQDQDVIIAVRESYIFLADHGYCGTVVLIEDIGDARYCRIQHRDGIMVMKEDSQKPVQLQEVIYVSFCKEHILTFNKSNEERIYLELEVV